MPLSTTLTRHALNRRRIVYLSATVGLLFLLLFTLTAWVFVWHRRAESHDKLAQNTQQYVLNHFDELQKNLFPLQGMTRFSCASIRNELTQRAAFTTNIRNILLVSDNHVYCSSASAEGGLETTALFAELDTRKSIDIKLASITTAGTNKPAILMWLANKQTPGSGIIVTLNINLTPWLLFTARQQEISGMAIITGDKALTSWEQRVVELATLPDPPLRTISLPNYPLSMQLYGEELPVQDINVLLLAGLLLGLFSGGGCYLLLMLRIQPGKEILLGIRRGEFHVQYQPVIEAATGKVYALEALMRWTHPTEGPIPPDTFIRYAEYKKLIVPLTRHLFELVARDCETLCQTVPAGTGLNLNISPAHLIDPEFYQDVTRWLEGMPQGHFRYVFEITERAMVEENTAFTIFNWLHSNNISIAIDDFGTGHSALIYLEKYNFDYLKIDRGFVQNIARETLSSPVLDAVLTLAKKLDLHTVAEGVETSEQARWLTDRGVHHMQGFLFSRPCTVSQLIDYFGRDSKLPPLAGKEIATDNV
ncbi:cyclic di-GMP phosphodiesterase [Pantoea sp. CCBC3-3-1]|uniref:cyclic di-GMP phosphodiesterase n=1 Tax=Pantoea sp. CCBC3-3-1 TaxID=2490851 RepID=UPI0011BDECE9|nr:cyclic di-GMP phosphodiesterase [Pantoea sp. CCBC3-3-1]